jgi:hypothetical protein
MPNEEALTKSHKSEKNSHNTLSKLGKECNEVNLIAVKANGSTSTSQQNI